MVCWLITLRIFLICVYKLCGKCTKVEMQRVFHFLGLDDYVLSTDEWASILESNAANTNTKIRPFEVDPKTHNALCNFYAPYDSMYGYNATAGSAH